MKEKNLKFSRSSEIACLAILGVILIGSATVIIIRVLYQSAWTVVGSSTGISYVVLLRDDSILILKEKLDAVASSHRMESIEIDGAMDRYYLWKSKSNILKIGQPKLNLQIDSYPREESDARKRRIYIIISTVDSNYSAWQELAKNVEISIRDVVDVKSVSIGIDGKIYGLCASKERPKNLDTGCRFNVEFPVDFKKFNEEILEPRLQGRWR